MAAASLLAVSCDLDKKPLANLSPDSFFSTRSELDAFANNFYSIFPASSIFEEESDLIIKIYGAQNEAYMSRSAEKWVRALCFNELGACG